MSDHSTYESLRHLADSWGLVAMAIVFVILCAAKAQSGSGRSHFQGRE
jgi:cytochrome c oxidase cbb3-type subunit 4